MEFPQCFIHFFNLANELANRIGTFREALTLGD